jgi:translation initiation factor 2 subunit 1
LVEQVALSLKVTVDEASDLFGTTLVEKYGSLFQAFEVASADAKRFQQENEKAPWSAAFLKVAQENIVPPQVTILGTLEISDPTADGVDHVRAALIAAEDVDPEAVEVHYVGAPKYRVRVLASQYKQAEETLKRATDAALKSIKAAGGEGTFTRA